MFAITPGVYPQNSSLDKTFARNSDYTLPVLAAHDTTGEYWTTDGGRAPFLGEANGIRTAPLFDQLYAAIPQGGDVVPEKLYTLFTTIISVLATFRQTYMHIGRAGMIIGIDGTKSAVYTDDNRTTPRTDLNRHAPQLQANP